MTRRHTIEPQAKETGDATSALHTKYRPATLEDVRGQEAIVKSIRSSLGSRSRPHAFLFTGPSGCGKTTLARIIARELGVESQNIIEADAATNTGIDATRALTDTLRYAGFGASANKMVILDECHALSKAAWQSLLKVLEEPPPHVYFALCTTEPGKVPDTISTRCQSYVLSSLRYADLLELIEGVAEAEGFKTDAAILQHVARAAQGSPRRALVMLAQVHDCTDAEEAALVLAQPFENKEVIDLCRLMVSGGPRLTWKKVQDTLAAIKDDNPESMRLVIVNYITACLMKSETEGSTVRLLEMLSQFRTPCNASEKFAPIVLALGNIVYPPNP